MYLTFGTFDQSIFWMKSSATRVGTRSAVGADTSNWPILPPCRVVIISSFEPNVSYDQSVMP